VDIAFRSASRTLALFGDSGAGKTTVLNAIAGLLRPDAGHVTLDHRVLFDRGRGVHLPVGERRVGYVFQDGRLFPHLTVRANLLYGARSRAGATADFDTLVELLDLAALLARRPA